MLTETLFVVEIFIPDALLHFAAITRNRLQKAQTNAVSRLLFFIETGSGVPLVKASVTGMSDKIDKQMAYVYFLFNFGGAIIFSFLVDPFHRFLTHFWPATEEENKSKVKYIYDQALQELKWQWMSLKRNRNGLRS